MRNLQFPSSKFQVPNAKFQMPSSKCQIRMKAGDEEGLYIWK
jgi:hypothetical protein